MTSSAPQSTPRIVVLELIQSATKADPITIREIRGYFERHKMRVPSIRRVKQIVAELRDLGYLIDAPRGSRDDEPAGYFLARTKDEKRNVLRAYWAQIATSIKRARKMAAAADLTEETAALEKMEQLSLLEVA